MTTMRSSSTPPYLQHLLSLEDLSAEHIEYILDRAAWFIDASHTEATQKKKLDHLLGCSVFNLFFEPSTRTLTTFAIAATRLSADVQSLNIARSSQSKGESILDTVESLLAMGADYFIIRHPQSGACDFVAECVGNRVHVINAGDGLHAHPTQGLLDLYTIRHYFPRFQNLSIVIVGDILHSRVARSQISGLQKLGVQDIRAVGPATVLPEQLHTWGVSVDCDFDRAIDGVDVIMMLRLQNERMSASLIPSVEEYFHFYGLTPERLKRAKPNALVMHPGPINRQVEIDSRVADCPQSVILPQVTFGITVRMAVLSMMNTLTKNA